MAKFGKSGLSPPDSPSDPKLLQVFLTGLSGAFQEHELLDFLRGKVPGVVSITLPKKSIAGFAFVTMRTAEAKEAILAAQNLVFKGRGLKAKEYKEGSQLKDLKRDINSRRLFVYSISKKMQDEELRRLFGAFGEIENAYIIRDRLTKKSRGFGYVVFTDAAVAVRVAERQVIEVGEEQVKVQMHDTEHKEKKERERRIPRWKREAEAFEYVVKGKEEAVEAVESPEGAGRALEGESGSPESTGWVGRIGGLGCEEGSFLGGIGSSGASLGLDGSVPSESVSPEGVPRLEVGGGFGGFLEGNEDPGEFNIIKRMVFGGVEGGGDGESQKIEKSGFEAKNEENEGVRVEEGKEVLERSEGRVESAEDSLKPHPGSLEAQSPPGVENERKVPKSTGFEFTEEIDANQRHNRATRLKNPSKNRQNSQNPKNGQNWIQAPHPSPILQRVIEEVDEGPSDQNPAKNDQSYEENFKSAQNGNIEKTRYQQDKSNPEVYFIVKSEPRSRAGYPDDLKISRFNKKQQISPSWEYSQNYVKSGKNAQKGTRSGVNGSETHRNELGIAQIQTRDGHHILLNQQAISAQNHHKRPQIHPNQPQSYQNRALYSQNPQNYVWGQNWLSGASGHPGSNYHNQTSHPSSLEAPVNQFNHYLEEEQAEEQENEENEAGTVQRAERSHFPTIGFHAVPPTNTSYFDPRIGRFNSSLGQYRLSFRLRNPGFEQQRQAFRQEGFNF